MNVYDFDGTIYDGDSCKDIVKYGLKKHFKITYESLKKAKKLNRDYKNGLVEFEKVKEELLSFIFKIPNYPKFINDFVTSHMKKIKPWYNSRKTGNDIIVTASYELWVKIFARNLGVKFVIGTQTDMEGKIIGRNCKGEEKVRKFRTIFPDAQVSCVYSDSASDIPLLKLGKTAYVVEGNKLVTYSYTYKFKNTK